MFDSIDKNTLKPGDVVGIKVKTQIGWGFFRYPKTIPLTIERHLPKCTLFDCWLERDYMKCEACKNACDKAEREKNVCDTEHQNG